MNYLYLHGFASGPQSSKAQFLQKRFAALGLTLHVPDLNLDNFSKATLTRQLQFLQATFGQGSMTAIGSSLGGFLAVQFAVQNPAVERLILLAPAFGFARCLADGLGPAAIAAWQETGSREFFHYGLQQSLPLPFDFLADAQTYTETALARPIPILIVHGHRDDVVPIALSEAFVSTYPTAVLETVDSDHSLGDAMELIWQKTHTFLNLNNA